MNTSQTLLLTALTSFVGGFLAGLILAPASGEESRRRLARSAEDSTRWLGDRVKDLEVQLTAIEEQLQASGAQLGERLREAAQQAADPYVPGLADEDEDWEMSRKEIAKDLRRMPRK